MITATEAKQLADAFKKPNPKDSEELQAILIDLENRIRAAALTGFRTDKCLITLDDDDEIQYIVSELEAAGYGVVLSPCNVRAGNFLDISWK